MKMLSLRQCVTFIKSVGPSRTIFLQGEKGIGKTSIHYMLQRDPFFANYIFPAPLDCTQMSDGSLWMPDLDREAGVSRELPNEALGMSKNNQRGVNGSRPVFVTFDEVGKAPQYIHNYLAPIVNEHRLGGYYMPEGSVTLCLTNLAQEGLGDSMKAHFADRMIHITVRKPTLDEWTTDYAIPHQLSEEVIATCHNFPKVFDSFLDYEEGGKYAGKDCSKDNPYITNPRKPQTRVATPRSIDMASDVVKRKAEFDEETLEHALGGTVGESFAKDIMSTIRFGQQMPEYERVISDPEHCPLPNTAVPQCIQVFQFVTRSEKEHVGPIVTYVKRMKKEMQGLFATTVSKNSSKAALFAVDKSFGQLLAAQRDYF